MTEEETLIPLKDVLVNDKEDEGLDFRMGVVLGFLNLYRAL